MKGAHIVKHSVSIAGHQTSISLEEIFWDSLRQIAKERNMPMRGLIAEIDSGRQEQNLSSAIRVYILQDMQKRLLSAPRSQLTSLDY